MNRPPLAAAVGLAAAIALSGCAPATPQASSPAPKPTASQNSARLTCDSLIDPATLSAIDPHLEPAPTTDYDVAPAGGTALSTARAQLLSPLNPPASTTLLAVLQTGYFDCQWKDGDTQTVRLSALPGATTLGDAPTYDVASFDGLSLGDRAVGGCTTEGMDGPFCRIDVLTGSTWVELTAGLSDPSSTSAVETMRTSLPAAARTALGIIATARPEPMDYPASRWSSVHDCSAVTAGATTIDPGFAARPVADDYRLDATDAYDPLFQSAVARSTGIGCYSGDSTTVTVVPGAEWAAPIAYTSPTVSQPTAAQASGVTGARTLCDSAGGTTCWAEGYIDHALVTAYGFGSPAKDVAVLAAVAVSTAKG